MSHNFSKILKTGKNKLANDLAIRHPYSSYGPEHSDLFSLDTAPGGPTMTKMADADSCDINNIMKRYEQTGLLPNVAERVMQYGDFSDAPTFQESMHIVAQAQSAFMEMPADTRAFFHNDPARFLEYMDSAKDDPSKGKKLVELGLAQIIEQKVDHTLETLKKIDENTRKGKTSTASKQKDASE